MEYKLYKLKFDTPVHFGSDKLAVSLEESDFICHSDTLFSALCLEYIKLNGAENLSKFVELFNNGELLISSLLPYKDKDLYIPKPSIVVERDNKKDDKTDSSSDRKKMKKLGFIKVSDLDNYLKSIKGEHDFNFNSMEYNKFSNEYLFQKVSLSRTEENNLYSVGVHHFYDKCGLYFILAYNNKTNLDIFEQIFKSLSYSGIGGKRTSGYGSFTLMNDSSSISDINKYLFKDAKYKMILSLYSPCENEIENIDFNSSYYSIIKRNGFIYSQTYSSTLLKRKSLCMFKEGSCFIGDIKGNIKDVSHASGSHEVYRYGKALYIGIDV